MFKHLFIDEPLEPLKESTESFILNCARKAIGPDYFEPYFKQFGNCGLGKTYELCVKKVIQDTNHGFSVLDIDTKSKIDIGLERGKKRIGIQIKTGKEYKGKFGLARIDENVEEAYEEIGSDSYIEGLKKECVKLKIDICYILYVSTSDGEMYLRKFCRMENGEIIMECDDDYKFKYSQKHTMVSIEQEQFPLVGKRKFEPLIYTPPKKQKLSFRKITVYELIDILSDIAKEFRKFDNFALGENWGDRGLAYEKFIIDELIKRGINAIRLKIGDIADVLIDGIGIIQIKSYYSRTTPNTFKVFCRSSRKNGSTYCIDNEFIDLPEIVVPDSSQIRKADIEDRIKKCLIEHGQKVFYMLEMDSYNELENMYPLSELCPDGSIKHIGSFLRSKQFFKSDGGKNGNQTHFYIKSKGLQKIENWESEFF